MKAGEDVLQFLKCVANSQVFSTLAGVLIGALIANVSLKKQVRIAKFYDNIFAVINELNRMFVEIDAYFVRYNECYSMQDDEEAKVSALLWDMRQYFRSHKDYFADKRIHEIIEELCKIYIQANILYRDLLIDSKKWPNEPYVNAQKEKIEKKASDIITMTAPALRAELETKFRRYMGTKVK